MWDGSFWCSACRRAVGEGGPLCGPCRKRIPGGLRVILDTYDKDTVAFQAALMDAVRHLDERRRVDDLLEPSVGGEG